MKKIANPSNFETQDAVEHRAERHLSTILKMVRDEYRFSHLPAEVESRGAQIARDLADAQLQGNGDAIQRARNDLDDLLDYACELRRQVDVNDAEFVARVEERKIKIRQSVNPGVPVDEKLPPKMEARIDQEARKLVKADLGVGEQRPATTEETIEFIRQVRHHNYADARRRSRTRANAFTLGSHRMRGRSERSGCNTRTRGSRRRSSASRAGPSDDPGESDPGDDHRRFPIGGRS